MKQPDLRKPTPVNRPQLALAATAERLGFNYFEALTLVAMGRFDELGIVVEEGAAALRLKAIIEGCSYLYPKRKAVEITGPDGGPLEHVLAMDPDLRRRRIQDLQRRLGLAAPSLAQEMTAGVAETVAVDEAMSDSPGEAGDEPAAS